MMYSTLDPIDIVITRMQQDLFNAGSPDPVDVLRWVLDTYGDRDRIVAEDVGVWFVRSFLPVARAAVPHNEPPSSPPSPRQSPL